MKISLLELIEKLTQDLGGGSLSKSELTRARSSPSGSSNNPAGNKPSGNNLSHSVSSSNGQINKAALKNDIAIFLSSEEEVTQYHNYIKFFFPSQNILTLPSPDSLPYDRLSSSSKILSSRAATLAILSDPARMPVILLASSTNLMLKYPSKEELGECRMKLQPRMKLNQRKLELFLQENNYSKNAVAIDPGEYARRGDIFDIVVSQPQGQSSGQLANTSTGYRINFEWDEIASIKYFDVETQISDGICEEANIYLASELKLTPNAVENFRNAFLRNFGIKHANDPFFEKISNSIKPNGAENIAPIFYDNPSSLLSYLKSPVIYSSSLAQNALHELSSDIHDFYNARKSSTNFFPAFAPEEIYFDASEAAQSLTNNIATQAQHSAAHTEYAVPNFFQDSFVFDEQNQNPFKLFLDFASKHQNKTILILCNFVHNLERVKPYLEALDQKYSLIDNIDSAQKNQVNIAICPTNIGFMTEDYICISDKELLGDKKQFRTSQKKKTKNIFKEYENFAENDLVVHKEYGIGKYDGIEQIEVDNIRHDCLKILYNKGDKLFIPVENAYDVKKFGEGDVALDTLGGVAWQRRKARLKERIGEMALSLINMAARRSLIQIEKGDYDLDLYAKFCDKFPYVETEDQLKACEDVLSDLKEAKPMDRLICGDVGFGKTEIAMRAAFLASQKGQVAVVVPTTILARQHYQNFKERYQGFPTKIGHLSRFVSAKDIELTKERLKNGEVDIVIGTHSLLASSISFHDLSMVIIDEEQHFGVAQKEKLKDICSAVHTLTLSATPIPRTLQLSLAGVKDLSLIATPPIDRLSVKTNLIEFDDVVIRDALLREKFRGGKSFFVAPRVSDLKELEEALRLIVPELSYRIAHGGLAPSSIDNIMEEFYEGKFDILLSTAIVESGLDVPSANTMIIYKAENFGLSQLYQLRGRVGRGKVRGYTYLVMSKKKMPTKSAVKRLEIMQSIDSLGAGFTIACHDMDLRGFGNMVGDEQSGHVKEVGVELYQEMLEEAINKLKDQDYKEQEQKPEVKINVPVYIPDEYIPESFLRLSIYRRAGEIESEEEIEQFIDELTDRFGPVPETMKNLIEIIRLKIICARLHIKSLDAGSGGFNVRFSDTADSQKIMGFVAKHPRNCKIKPDNKLVFIQALGNKDLITKAHSFLGLFN